MSASRSFVVGAVLGLAFAGGAQFKAQALAGVAAEKAQVSVQHGARFTQTFDGKAQDEELALLDERRTLLEAASTWRRAGMFALVLAAVALFGAWVARELSAIREVVDGAGTPPPAHKAT